jgi:hypothetical protein
VAREENVPKLVYHTAGNDLQGNIGCCCLEPLVRKFPMLSCNWHFTTTITIIITSPLHHNRSRYDCTYKIYRKALDYRPESLTYSGHRWDFFSACLLISAVYARKRLLHTALVTTSYVPNHQRSKSGDTVLRTSLCTA